MTKQLMAVLLCGVVAAGCNTDTTTPAPIGAAIHSVNFEDAQLSLSVSEHAGGRVTGKWTEELAKGAQIQVVASCLLVRGNEAWVGGVITESTIRGVVGKDAVVRIDQTGGTSYTIMGGGNCRAMPRIPLLRVTSPRVSLQ